MALLSCLRSLRELALVGTDLHDISFLQGMEQLEQLDVQGNALSHNQLTDLRPLRFLLRQQLEFITEPEDYGIRVQGNPLVHPPLHVVEQGTEAVQRYFEKNK